MRLCENPMKTRRDILRSAAILMFIQMALATSQSQTHTSEDGHQPVFRPPFVLRLQIDDEHYYQQSFNKVPYVSAGEVYLFAGEHFGVNVTMAGDQVVQLTYQPDPAKADVEFKFTQEKPSTGLMMLLMIQNRLKRRLSLDALMTVPNKTDAFKTSVLPIQSGLSSFVVSPQPATNRAQSFTVTAHGGGPSAPISVRLAGKDYGTIGQWSDGYHIPYINGYSYQQCLPGGYAPSQ